MHFYGYKPGRKTKKKKEKKDCKERLMHHNAQGEGKTLNNTKVIIVKNLKNLEGNKLGGLLNTLKCQSLLRVEFCSIKVNATLTDPFPPKHTL